MAPARYLDALAAGTGYDAPAHPLANVGRIGATMLDFLNARARLDGETVRHTTAPDRRIPAGETRLVFRYLPPGFRRGALISAVTLAAAAAAAAVLARRRA